MIFPLAEGMREGNHPPYTGDPLDWIREHVRLPHSARSAEFDPMMAPHLNAPMRAILGGRHRSVLMRLPTGAGKTTMLELIIPYVIAVAPGPMLLVEQTDDTSKDWAESRLMPVLEGCEPVARLFPEDRHQKRKSAILFPHCALFLTGANMSGLQGKSMRYVWCDEVWQYRPGILGEAQKRMHDRYNRVFIGVSQGWDTGHEAEDLWRQGETMTWGHACVACACWLRWNWNEIKYQEKPEDGEWDWATLRESVHHECPECGHVTPNTTAHRRAMAAQSDYRSEGGNFVAGHINFTLPAWAIWWIDWADLVVEWVKAQDAKRRGHIEPLKQFLQKRGAQTWSTEEEAPVVNLLAADYRLVDYANGEKINSELTRFLTVDCQQDHYWVCLRAWRGDGSSMLLWFGKHLTLDSIRDYQQRMGVRDNLVFIDSGYRSGDVYEACAKYGKTDPKGQWIWNSGWTALKGSKQERFGHIPASGKRVDRFFSPPSKVMAASGRFCRLVNWSNLIAKDKLTQLRAAGPDVWGFPTDVGGDYMSQVTAEVCRDVVDNQTKAITRRYVAIRRDNHAWDCEAMQVVAASIVGVLRGEG